MFQQLNERLSQTIKYLTGRGKLTEQNIQDALREVRLALLEADVALTIVAEFVENIKAKAIGEEVIGSITPGQAFIKVVHDQLISTMGQAVSEINLRAEPPVVILLAGLQGSGKTTTTAKLSHLIKTRLNKKVLVTSVDVYRPAAIKQLEVLATQIGVEHFPSTSDQNPVEIAKNAVQFAKSHFADVVIIDTAGRLHIDKEMMDEVKAIHDAIMPTETLFVVDSMTGQDAANTAKAFNAALPLTGVILTKTDGDARGGAALSVWGITKKPIKFIGTGEKIDALDLFYPDRVASQILGMGDIVSLVEEVQRKVDHKKAEKLAKKFKKGKAFDLQDFLEQLEQMNQMGSMSDLISKLPGIGQLPKNVTGQINDSMFVKMKAMIQSMTPKERRFPDVIRATRKIRIAKGSGTQVQDVNRLLKQFEQMQKTMKKIQKGGMANMMRKLSGMLPPGMKMPPMGMPGIGNIGIGKTDPMGSIPFKSDS